MHRIKITTPAPIPLTQTQRQTEALEAIAATMSEIAERLTHLQREVVYLRGSISRL
jgi:hypothetical protein